MKQLANLDAEQGVLGSMLLDEATAHQMLSMLVGTDFYSEAHAVIWEVIRQLLGEGEPLDIITVTSRGKKLGHEQLVSTELLIALVESVPTSANATFYADLVKEQSIRRQGVTAATELYRLAQNDDMSTEDIIGRLGDSYRRLTEHNKTGLKHVSELAVEHYAAIEQRTSGDHSKLFGSGFTAMDRCFGKLGESQLITLKGTRGSGKTHMAVHWLCACANSNRTAVMFSMEMKDVQMLDRIIAHEMGEDSRRLRTPSTEDWEWIARGEQMVSAMDLYIDDRTGLTVDAMLAACEGLKGQGHDVGLVVVDFMELVGSSKSETREQELSRITMGFRNFANILGCTVVILSQVNEEGKERGSRGIGNLSDLLLAWECDKDSDDGTLTSEKNRMGPPFRVDVKIDKRCSRCSEIVDIDVPAYYV